MQPVSLPFHDLASRHPGVTNALGSTYTEAASVCLDRHHVSPVDISIDQNGIMQHATAYWARTDERTRGAWANEIDATEAGAYGIALAVVEISVRMVALRRAETRTGADYYVGPPDAAADDLENWLRLEVSGLDGGDEYAVRQRLREKIRQALRGVSNLPALAAVIGFRAKFVALAPAEAA